MNADERNAIIEECARVAQYAGIESACKKRRTRTLGLQRDTYPTEVVREVVAAIREMKKTESSGTDRQQESSQENGAQVIDFRPREV